MYETAVTVIAAAWFAIGLGLSLFMARRGHGAFGWFVLGTLMGPLAVVLAAAVRRHPEERASRSVEPSRAADVAGAVDVLAGLDESPESLAALDGALALLGDRVGRLTIATVLPYEAGREDERVATERLLKARDHSGRADVGLDLLHGRPGAALMKAASDGGYELVVVGKRGTGLANRLIGSTATDLASRSEVAVLLPGD